MEMHGVFMIYPPSHRASLLVFRVVTDSPSSRGRHTDLATQWGEYQGCIIEK